MPSFWEGLGKHQRAGLVLSIIMVLLAAAASFTLSFLALREVAGNAVTGWGQTAWVFPVCIDAGLVACEITLLTLSMMAGTALQQFVAAFFMLVFGAFTVYFNAVRVPPAWRAVTAAPPITGIILTIMFAVLLKAFAKHTGVAWTRPPTMGFGPTTTVMQLPDGSYGVPGSPFPAVYPQQGFYGQIPSSMGSGNPQLGHGQMDDASKRRAAEMYLSGLTSDQLGVATGSSIQAALAEQGVPITERYARTILDEYTASGKSTNGTRVTRRK